MRFESALPNETWQSDMTHWQRVLVLMADLDVRVIDQNGATLRHFELDPSIDYQARSRDIV